MPWGVSCCRRTLPCTTACSPYTMTLPGADTIKAGARGDDTLRACSLRGDERDVLVEADRTGDRSSSDDECEPLATGECLCAPCPFVPLVVTLPAARGLMCPFIIIIILIVLADVLAGLLLVITSCSSLVAYSPNIKKVLVHRSTISAVQLQLISTSKHRTSQTKKKQIKGG